MDDVFRLEDGDWIPSEFARGPFAGLQGGAVAGLLVSELERHAAAEGWGLALSTSVQFLRPAPLAPLTTETEVLRAGKRAAVTRNQLSHEGTLLAVATVTFVQDLPVSGIEPTEERRREPGRYEQPPRRNAPHGGPWFMDTLDVRDGGDGIRWFGIERPITSPATPMATVLGPADWTHGLGRPDSPKLADPNIDLVVQLTRRPEGHWIGVEPDTRWVASGRGRGRGLLYDEAGEIGAVSMGVTLLPFRAPAAGAGT